ncbi:type II secretion system F family protein [Thermococcus sp. M36]|uniref:type II secretion system F family protein n=1 Tax=Thermococcus sp. M36 TaxID=1638261 RepID=UPI001439AB22|nr:type II secretion system F family protein [Thermococcus sp. M36]NJE05530.1 type II secretion system F family protein [Thermococcus sp. M36]
MAGISSFITAFLERILPKKWLRKYELFIYSAGINFLSIEYIVISILSSVVAALATYLVMASAVYAVLLSAAVFAGIAFVYPYWRTIRRIEQMEKMLPDAFFYLASSLRAGISFSEALEELAMAKFGALTEEFRKTVSEIRKGRSTVDAMRAFALRNKRSQILYRSVMIIIEALERGAPMSDVLVFVGNDVREILRIKQERKASTGMQTMFFIMTSGFIGPLIMGVVAKVMGSISAGAVSQTLTAVTGSQAIFPVEAIQNVLLGFIVLQAVVSGLGIGVIREGKYSAGLKYSLLLAVLGVVTYKVTVSAGISI